MGRKVNLNANHIRCAGGLVVAVKSGDEPNTTLPSRLTGAETRVLALVTLAKTNKEIARDLGISPATVKRHLENVLRKLGLRNRVEAAIYGLLVNGCPAAMNSGCPLKSWHQAREIAAPNWAD
jgi:DNA-binding CsgD family transcriptional regulator